MIQQRKKRIVLFLPHRADPDEGVRVAADLLPLELLQIAALPEANGFEVHIVDAMVHEDYMRRLEELCDGALLFASSCILGFQVAHGARVARKIRDKFPDLPIIWGGWFPSVIPERYFEEGIADAVGLGQGELTFSAVAQAPRAGREQIERVHAGAHVTAIQRLRGKRSTIDADTHTSAGSVEAAERAAGAAVRGVEELIGAIGAAGTKILMTTHDIAQARRLAADVMFLNHGRLLEHAPASEFFGSPKDPVAAGFLAGELPA